MIYVDIINSHKLGVFLGASLAMHAVVLSQWPAPGNPSGERMRSIQMVLSPEANQRLAESPPAPAIKTAKIISSPPPQIQEQNRLPIVRPEPMRSQPPLAVARTSNSFARVDSPTVMPTPPIQRKHFRRDAVVARAKTVPEQKPSPAAVATPVPKPRQIMTQSRSPSAPTQRAEVASAVPTALPASPPAAASQIALAPALGLVKFNRASAVENANQQAQVNPPSTDFSHLSALLHKEILQRRHYPNRAKRQRREGIATVRFLLFPNGDIRSVSLDTTSGFKALDVAALQAVKNVAPFNQARDYLSQAQEFNVNVIFKLR